MIRLNSILFRGFANKYLTLLTILSATLLISCSTDKPTLNQVVYNHGSMTKSLKSLDSTFSVQILKTGVDGHKYIRISSLKLNNQPVIAAISQTRLKDKTFVSLLANADTKPIGNILFSPNSPIKRQDTMIIKSINLKQINNPVIVNYLTSLGYNDSQTFISRKSQFYYRTESMDLVEYILPTINQFVAN